jgi:hypothetical protein
MDESGGRIEEAEPDEWGLTRVVAFLDSDHTESAALLATDDVLSSAEAQHEQQRGRARPAASSPIGAHMAKGQRVEVGTSPTRLSSSAGKVGEKRAVYFKNKGAVSVDIGGDDVETDEGYELEAGEGVSLDVIGRDDPYAVAASGTVRVDVFESGTS